MSGCDQPADREIDTRLYDDIMLSQSITSRTVEHEGAGNVFHLGRKCRVLVVDDNVVSHTIVSTLLSSTEWITIVGRAYDGFEALEHAKAVRPDVILMDLQMPNMGGLEATRLLRSSGDQPLIVIMTGHEDPEYQAAARAAGADGFLIKSELSTHLLPLVVQLLTDRGVNPAS